MPIVPTMRRLIDDKRVPAFGPEYFEALEAIGIDIFKPNDQELIFPRHQAFTESPLYIPQEWNEACGGFDAPRAKFYKQPRVLIVGAGLAGTRTALEYTKCGNKPILIEALPHVGGRMSGVKGKGQVEYLPGSMRYPPSEGSLFELAYYYGFGMQAHFTDPGISPTLLAFSNQIVQYWNDPTTIPKGFETVFHGWNALLKEGFKIDETDFAAPAKLAEFLQSPDIMVREKAISLWQNYITNLKDEILEKIMKAIFIDNPNPPGGKKWTMEDLEDKWGKGGIGSGGFGVFFGYCALTILRFLPNELETDQCSFVENVNGKWKAAAAQKLVQAIFDDAARRGIDARFETELVDLCKSTDNDGKAIYIATVNDKKTKKTYHIECDVPILTMPPKVIVKLGLARDNLFPPEICEALLNIFMVETTKIFVSIPKKYFEDPTIARVILGDLFQTYIMDFKDPKYLAGLLDYAWHTKSLRYGEKKDPKECFAIIKEDITKALEGSKYESWLNCLKEVEEYFVIHWQDSEYQLGAFPFLEAGQDKYCNRLFHWTGKGSIRLTGEGFTPYGGWSEGALIKTDHDFAHTADEYGEVLYAELSPIHRMKQVFEY